MSDWQKGDLALCIRGDESAPVDKGWIGTVAVAWEDIPGTVLLFDEVEPTPPYRGFVAAAFVKVTPPKDLIEERRTEEVEA